MGDLDAITTVHSVKVGLARKFHDNTSLIDKHSGQFFNDSPPLSEAGSAPSDQSQVKVCSDEIGLAELEEWHGIHDTTIEMAAIDAESPSNLSSDHRQLLVKPSESTSELYPSTHHV